MKTAWALGLISLLTVSGMAQEILDSGFEDPLASAWTSTSTVKAFSVIGPDSYNVNPGLDGANRGRQFMRSYYGADATGSTKVSQVIPDALAPKTHYVLSVDVASNAGASKTLPSVIDIRLKDQKGSELPIVSFIKPIPPQTQNSNFVRWIKTYYTSSNVFGSALSIEMFTSQSEAAGFGNDRFVAFDNVSLKIDPIPKPSTITNRMIFNHGQKGEWDANQVQEPCILVNPKDSSKLIMFYSGAGVGGIAAIGVAWANKSDPYTWHLNKNNPVFTKARSGWDDSNIRLDCVVYNQPSDEYWMYYSGSHGTGIADHIGLAKCRTGDDGYSNVNPANLIRHPMNPILSPGGSLRKDETAVSQSAVLKKDSTHWYMYYSYRTAAKTLPGIRLAVSSDGMTWNKQGGADLFATTANAYYEWHQIFTVGNTYVLSMEVGPNHGSRWRTVLASSLNPASGWKQSPVDLIQQTSWPNYGNDATTKFFHVATPAFYKIGDNWHMYYQAAPGGAYIAQSWTMWGINCQLPIRTISGGATIYIPGRQPTP